MAISHDDRRTAPRFEIEVPLSVQVGEHTISTTTKDLAPHGVRFCLEPHHESSIGKEIVFTLELPPEITLTVAKQVSCQARVVRKLKNQLEGLTIAAHIHSYKAKDEA